MNKLIALTSIALLTFAFGCGGDDDTTPAADSAYTSGNFVVTVLDVDDACFDGAMNTIVLPDGTARDLPAPVALPGYADLPAGVDIQFSAPFQSVTGSAFVANGENGLMTDAAGIVQTGVDISDGGDCLADMSVHVQLIASDNDTLTGSGYLEITSATGADCPVFAGSGCKVTSNVSAVRQ